MCTVLVSYDASNQAAQNLVNQLSQTQGVEIDNKERKRIPVSKIYWEKGDYEELVEDPFNLKS